MHAHIYTPLEPLTMSAALQGNQASGDRSALAHVYIHGLNLALFLSAAGKKEMYLICTIPIWPVHLGEIHRESRPKVRASPFQYNLFCRSACIYSFAHVRRCALQYASMRSSILTNTKTSYHIPDLYCMLKQWQLG